MKKDNIFNFKKKRYFYLVALLILLFISFFIPKVSLYKYSDQNLDFVDLPPFIKLYMLSSDYGVYLHKDLYPVLFNKSGQPICLLKKISDGYKFFDYEFDNKKLSLDYKKIKDFKNIDYKKIKLIYDGRVLNNKNVKIVWNKTYILGSDQLGRDIFTRVFQGIKISLTIGFMSSIVNLVIGIIYGSISGYIGGKIDIIMVNILNIISTIPSILWVILMSLFIPQGLWTIIIIIGSVYWINMARQVRAGVMAIKRRDFILAQIVMGTPHYKIVFKHILPNMKETILMTLIVSIQNAIFTETFLSFLGIGLSAPIASLGTLINDAMGNFRSCPYQLIIPAMAILLIFICFDKILDSQY